MVEAKVVRDMDFSAEQVWAVLEDYGNMAWTGAPDWVVIGEGIGMIRQVRMEGLDPIDEVLETMDPANMTFSYTIPRGLPLPVTDYRSTARVEALDDGRSRVHWTCECTPTDPSMSDADIQALMEDTYGNLLNGLTTYIGEQP